jgi:hypothetical protein
MKLNLLTAKSVEAKKERGRYSDGGGLVLQISKWKTKSWAFRYQRDVGGRARDRHMGLGSVHALSLADARERARECRELLVTGIDPIEEQKAKRQEQLRAVASGLTFKACAAQYIAAHEAAWGNAKHRAQWSSTLEAYAYPVIGELAVSSIDTALVLKCLEPIWTKKPG